jgi:hypothetical protein
LELKIAIGTDVNCRTFPKDQNAGRVMENPMMTSRVFAVAALAVGTLLAANASAQAPEGKFRGMYVCEKLPMTRDILRAPLDLVIDGGSVQFARPLFNLAAGARRCRNTSFSCTTMPMTTRPPGSNISAD